MLIIDLPSLACTLGEDEKSLYLYSNHKDSFYKKVNIPKKDGGTRQLTVPSSSLKWIQAQINQSLLKEIPISKYATAYHTGSRTVINASNHQSANAILKLDIYHFFDSITYSQVRSKVFNSDRFDSPAGALLSQLCTFDNRLPQGAPTSPTISNIIMYDFDECVGAWCELNEITYTRYCDDMTFSGVFDPKIILTFIENLLHQEGFRINNKKSAFLRQGQRMSVTGLVVNDKVSVPADYKRKIRQEIYYCQHYGIESHLQRIESRVPPEKYLQSLLGKVQYVLSVSSSDEFVFYQDWLKKAGSELQAKRQYEKEKDAVKWIEKEYEWKRQAKKRQRKEGEYHKLEEQRQLEQQRFTEEQEKERKQRYEQQLSSFLPGARVHHPKYGDGVVLALGRDFVSVSFLMGGERKFILPSSVLSII